MKIYTNRYTLCILITPATVLTFSFMNNTFSVNVANSIVPNITTSTCHKLDTMFINYPNPFNPTTKIKFDITSNVKSEKSNVPLSFGEGLGLRPRRGVRLTIYDILAREVSVLVNEQLKPGTYEVEWDASNFPSGVYFYKLETSEYLESKKMVLLK